MNKQVMAIALAAAAVIPTPAQATSVALATDGSWNELNIDSFVALDFDDSFIDCADGSCRRTRRAHDAPGRRHPAAPRGALAGC